MNFLMPHMDKLHWKLPASRLQRKNIISLIWNMREHSQIYYYFPIEISIYIIPTHSIITAI